MSNNSPNQPAATHSGPEPEFALQLQDDLPKEDVRRVLAVFAAELPQFTADIATAAAAKNGESMRKTAHAFAGAAGAVGAHRLDEVCRIAMRDASADAAGLLAHSEAILSHAALAENALQRVLAGL